MSDELRSNEHPPRYWRGGAGFVLRLIATFELIAKPAPTGLSINLGSNPLAPKIIPTSFAIDLDWWGGAGFVHRCFAAVRSISKPAPTG
jgi:hypothetical protein